MAMGLTFVLNIDDCSVQRKLYVWGRSFYHKRLGISQICLGARSDNELAKCQGLLLISIRINSKPGLQVSRNACIVSAKVRPTTTCTRAIISAIPTEKPRAAI